MKKFELIIAAGLLVMTMALTSCGEKKIATGDLTIAEEDFGGIDVNISEGDFAKLGFEPGDSVDVKLSNGYEKKDVPYYTGYYVNPGDPLVIGYPGDDSITFKFNYAPSAWEESGASGKDTIRITLAGKGKYKSIEENLHLEYSVNREDYESDEAYANFRAMRGGNLKDDMFFRSSSPYDTRNDRADYTDDVMEKEGIGAILNITDEEKNVIEALGSDKFNSPYFKKLYEDGKVLFSKINANYKGEEFKKKLGEGLKRLSDYDGEKILIHCYEGKDRTGFVCALLEALAGADYQEMVDDYMLTYDNFYGVNKKDTPEKYETILQLNFEDMLRTIAGVDKSANLKTADYRTGAVNYLKDCGLTAQDIESLLDTLVK